jgi:tetratricopeptide (TPR) repeat protein
MDGSIAWWAGAGPGARLDRMAVDERTVPRAEEARTEPRDFYAVLGAEPSASGAELRAAFREAVLRYHPDRATVSPLSTRRTSVLNRAWSELRDPLRRLHYDRALEHGLAETLEWPLEVGEPESPPPRRRRIEPVAPSQWHQPQWRNVAGFRVPVEIWLQGPVDSDRWIVEHHITSEDWREHRERYWLRFAARYYRDRNRVDDWIGALERLIELDPSFDTLVSAHLREAYLTTQMYLRGAEFLRRIGARWPEGAPQRRFVEQDVRAILGAFRNARVRRGPIDERAEAAELLLNFLEALDVEPSIADVRAAVAAHRRAGHAGRAAELVERAVDQPIAEAGRWYSVIQLLTESGQFDRASRLLAEVARGEHPEALNARAVRGDPARRLSAARERLNRARRRAAASAP